MKPSDDGSVLHVPIQSTGVSEAFIAAAESNGYHTLSEILAIPLTELVKMNWLTEPMLKELGELVEKLPPAAN